jgi:hypothetical protein
VVAVAQQLAQAIVRDGEGATKFITVRVQGGRDEAECKLAAYAIAHSPLVKTAFFASDPNLGRILAAVGYAGIADLDQSLIDLHLDDVHVVTQGGRHPDYQEADGQRVMKQSEITSRVHLHRGGRGHGVDLRPVARLRQHQRRLPVLKRQHQPLRFPKLPRLPPDDLLRDTAYRRLWTSILTSSFGNQVMMLALPLTAAVLLHATPTQMGLLTAIELLPFLLLFAASGVWLDRVRKLPVYVVGESLVAVAPPACRWPGGWAGWAWAGSTPWVS